MSQEYSGQTHRGLRPNEWQDIQAKDLSFLETAVASLTPFSSLSLKALTHLSDSWISYRDEFLRITVPETDSCNQYKMISGNAGGNIPLRKPRREPCRFCRNIGDTDGFENIQSDGERKREVLTLHRDLAKPAVEFIEKIFCAHGRSELSVAPTSVGEAARRVWETDTRERSYTMLRRTAPVIYAHYGLSKSEIVDLTTYTQRTVEHIVDETPGVNFSQVSTVAFLREVSDREPVTTKELSQALEINRSNIYQRLFPLEEEGRLDSKNRGVSGPAATWETTSRWNDPFVCNECGYRTYSLCGIRTHRSSHNE